MAIINQICNGCNGGKRSLNHRRFMGFEGYIWISLYYNCLTKTNHFFLRRFAPQLWSHIFSTDSGNWKFQGTVQNLDVLHAFPPWVEVAKGPVAIAGTSVWISTSSAGTWYRLIQDLPGRKNPSFCWNWIFRIATAFPFFCHQISAVRTAKIIRLQGTIPLNSLPDNLDILCPRMLIPIA